MALPIYIEMEGVTQGKFDGGVQRKGREKWIEGIAVEHQVYVPTDRLTGSVTGSRVHNAFYLMKEIDKSSPMILKALVTNESLKSVIIHFYQPGKDGKEVEFYNIKMTDAAVTSVETILPHVHTRADEKPQEKIALRYGAIEWTFTEGNIVANDQWLVPAGA
jgi:type VI secretion system secreted protein Hcp